MPSSKKTDNTDCMECNRRRIKCDLQKPECLKCQRAGIQCSGPGKFRFNVGVATRGKLKNLGYPAVNTPAQAKPPSGVALRWRHMDPQQLEEAIATESASRSGSRSRSATKSPTPSTSYQAESQQQGLFFQAPEDNLYATVASNSNSDHLTLQRLLAPLSSQKRDLFGYWATCVTTPFVLYPDLHNGFIHYFIPLACSNELVSDAICVVASQHRSLTEGRSTTYSIEEQRASVLSRLNQLCLDPQHTPGCLVVPLLLILLMGAVVTGSDQFRPLLQALLAFVKQQSINNFPDDGFRCFVAEQIFAFLLCSGPFAPNDNFDSTSYDWHLESFLSILYNFFPADPNHIVRLKQVVDSAVLTRKIFLFNSLGLEESASERLSEMRILLQEIAPGSDAEHRLVWAYFITGVSCHEEADRDFFIRRLQGIHDRTGFENVRLGIEYLEERARDQRKAEEALSGLQDFDSLIM